MNAEYERALGQNIRVLRMKKGFSQEQLAAQLQVRGCDVTRSALAKIEVGSGTSTRTNCGHCGTSWAWPLRNCSPRCHDTPRRAAHFDEKAKKGGGGAPAEFPPGPRPFLR